VILVERSGSSDRARLGIRFHARAGGALGCRLRLKRSFAAATRGNASAPSRRRRSPVPPRRDRGSAKGAAIGAGAGAGGSTAVMASDAKAATFPSGTEVRPHHRRLP
jgi:hypothetical protein